MSQRARRASGHRSRRAGQFGPLLLRTLEMSVSSSYGSHTSGPVISHGHSGIGCLCWEAWESPRSSKPSMCRSHRRHGCQVVVRKADGSSKPRSRLVSTFLARLHSSLLPFLLRCVGLCSGHSTLLRAAVIVQSSCHDPFWGHEQYCATGYSHHHIFRCGPRTSRSIFK